MPIKMLRRRSVSERTGKGNSTIYEEIKQGLFVSPVAISKRSVAWPEHEVDAINAARINGKNDEEIRSLVIKLEAARKDPPQTWGKQQSISEATP